MKRTISVILVLCLSMMFSAPAMAVSNYSIDITSLQQTGDDLQESDKLYMNGGVTTQEKVRVILQKPSNLLTADAKAVSGSFSFEASIYSENPDSIYSQFQKDISFDRNSTVVKTLTVDPEVLSFLTDFTNKLTETYVTETKPDLSSYYDLTTGQRQENRFLVENFIYRQAIIKPSDVYSFSNKIYLQDIKSLGNNALLVEFYLDTKLAKSDGDEEFGNTNYAYLILVNGGYRVVKYWSQHFGFVYVQKKIQDRVSKADAIADSDLFSSQLLSDFILRKNAILSQATEQDSIGISLKSTTLLAATTYSTLSYDRVAVVKAAKKYAIYPNYNPLFVDMTYMGGDCTNYVSQCIWQSPGWKFDKIGKNTSFMWSCTKQTSGTYAGKYLRDPPSWAGVDELFYYMRNNDNKSLAGTVYGISATTTGYTVANVQKGDVIQFGESNSGPWHHSTFVVSVPTSGTHTAFNVLVAAHDYDTAGTAVSEYLDTYPGIRVIHIKNYIVG